MLFLFSKASRLFFIFVHVSAGHTHIPNDEIHIPWMPMRPNTLFFGCRMPEKTTRNVGLKSVDGRYTCFSTEKETPSRQSIPVRECMQTMKPSFFTYKLLSSFE